MDWGELLRAAVHDRTNPPLFYLLLKAWIGIGGESVAWMRLLPCLMSIATAVPLAALSRLMLVPPVISGNLDGPAVASRWPAIAVSAVALSVAASSPLAVFLANELRGYSLVLLLTTASLLAFARAMRGAPADLRRRLVQLTLTNGLLVYSHYFGWLVVAAECGAALFWHRRALRGVLASTIAVGAAFAPWALIVAADAQTTARPLTNVDWITQPALGAIPEFYDALVARVLTPELAWVGAVVILTALMVGAFRIGSSATTSSSRTAMELIWFALFPVAAIFAAGYLTGRSAFVPRYLIVAAPAWWTLLAFAVSASVGTRKWSTSAGGASAVFIAFVLTAGALREARGGEKINWDRIAAAIATDAGSRGGTVYAREGFVALPVAYYAAASGSNLAVRRADKAVGITDGPSWFVVRYASSADSVGVTASIETSDLRAVPLLTERIPSQIVTAFRLARR